MSSRVRRPQKPPGDRISINSLQKNNLAIFAPVHSHKKTKFLGLDPIPAWKVILVIDSPSPETLLVLEFWQLTAKTIDLSYENGVFLWKKGKKSKIFIIFYAQNTSNDKINVSNGFSTVKNPYYTRITVARYLANKKNQFHRISPISPVN